MDAPAPASALYADAPLLRLTWLVQLRWVALGVAVLGLLIATALHLPFVAPRPIIAAIAVGALYNTWFLFRLRRLQCAPTEPPEGAFHRELELQAIADVGALTLLLSACGGLRNPISAFYGFHIVIGTVLGLWRGAVLAGAVSLMGVSLLALAEHVGMLLAAPIGQPPLWLCGAAVALNVLSLGYFARGALSFWQRAEGRALLNYQLLLNGLDELHAGLELVGPGDRLLLANRRAASIHPSPGGRWQAPEPLREDAGPRRLLQAASGEPALYEVVALAGSKGGVRAYLYIDRTEVTVSEQRAMMLERLASLGRALQQVAHELNTPLATIQTLAVDLSHALVAAPVDAPDPQPPAPKPDDVGESIRLIIDEARRCRAITHDLLSTARAGDPAERARRRVVLREVIARAVRLVYGGKPGSGAAAGVAVSGALDRGCVTDADRLLQILVNLLQNARDASDAVEISVDAVAAEFVIAVRDRGPGLPPEVRARLFTPFVTTKPPGKGTGLGLYTCELLARQLGATLTIESPDDGGVRAELRLPS